MDRHACVLLAGIHIDRHACVLLAGIQELWVFMVRGQTYLERLPDGGEKESFRKQVLAACRESYPQRKHKRILYPFDRFLLFAYKV
jgi:trans-aconitate methyltransferase